MIDRLNQWGRKLPTWPLYLLGLLPIPYLFWQGLGGALGVDPVKALEHEYGLLGLQFLIASLCITPLRRYAGLNLLKFRRALGLIAFAYIAAHLLVWAVLDVQSLSRVWADLVKRPYITVGMLAFTLMLPLAVTSYNRAIRALGRRWTRLHKLTYGVAVLAGVHFVMQAKGLQITPLTYLAGIAILLLMRLHWRRASLARSA